MADDVTPSDVRARRFDATRRGYDRTQVDAYLSSLANEIEQLQSKIESRATKELKVGLDDPEALALELGSIGGEVATILEAARAAADGMRKRAAGDVDEWRSTTQRETKSLTSDAAEQSQSMRASAWNEGSSMLSSAVAEARNAIESAQEDALFIRAEAEREAIRLTGDAKRDREELIRGARHESEEMIENARSESDGMLAAASQQAEQAQERARALEDRRAELLSELESTRASIGHLEDEIDSRRQELETPEPFSEPVPDPSSHHAGDGGSVRIVAPSRSMNLRPVVAEELVADVVALRSGTPILPDPVDVVETAPVEPETVTVIAPPPPAGIKVHDQAVDQSTTEFGTASETEPATTPEPTVDTATDDIGSLFASLRDVTSEPDPEPPPPENSEPDTYLVDDETVLSSTESVSTDSGDAALDVDPDSEVDGESVDAFAEESLASDSNLIPLQNAALKDIKRTLVDLQNDALEQLRNDTGWVPKKSFTNKFKESFGSLAESITGSKGDGGASKEFSADLHSAVTGAMSKARDAGAGERQVASAVSRVFRMWRADEAERRVLDAAQTLSR